MRITLARSAVAVTQDRLDRGVRQLATVSASGIRLSQTRYQGVAKDAAIREVLASPKPDANAIAKARDVLSRLRAPADSGMPIELWDAEGRRIAWVGDDLRDSIAVSLRPEMPAPPAHLRKGLDSLVIKDSLQFSTLYREGGRTHLWLVLPIVESGRAAGFVAQHRWISGNPEAEKTIRELSGDSVGGYYKNLDGSAATSFGGVAIEPEPRTDDMLSAESQIAGTPLILAMRVPRRVVLESTQSTVRTLGLLSGGLTLIAAMLAWAVGRRVAKPIVEITRAAEAMGRGEYHARVPTRGSEEVARLANTFNSMAAQVEQTRTELEAASRAKSDFLAAMSHELRTPLNAIGGYTEIISLGLRGPVSEQQLKDLERIQASQQHLLGLISSVLDMTRIETGRVSFNLAPVDVHGVLSSLEALIAPQAAAKQLLLVHERGEPVTAHADAEKLRQILLNLVSNAIKHSPAGGTITLLAYPRDDGKTAIEVSDAGPGIPVERHEEIFEPFVQLDRSLTSPSEGVGLGLAISRDLARGMGGELTVANDARGGARFTLVLPS